MDIRPDPGQLEQLSRRRPPAPGQSAGSSITGAGGGRQDEAAVSLDPQTAARYVDRLRRHDPTDLHRLQDLRSQIDAGTYTAEPAELADRLLEALDRGILD